jgi:hypothetical protein
MLMRHPKTAGNIANPLLFANGQFSSREPPVAPAGHGVTINGACYECTLVKPTRTAKSPRQELVATLGKDLGLKRHNFAGDSAKDSKRSQKRTPFLPSTSAKSPSP